ncbi:MAG: DUF4340 domain-containing protein [Verrucomicrobiota bacterium]
MRVTTTAVLAGVAILLAIVIGVIDRDPTSNEGAAKARNVLVRFDMERADRMIVEKGPSKTVIEKKNGGWFLIEPEVDRADAGAIAVLLDQFNHLTIFDELEMEKEGIRPESIGLVGDEAVKVSISGPEEESSDERFEATLVMGLEAPRADSMYAQAGDTGPVVVVDGYPRKWLERPVETLRDARVLGAPVEAIVQMVIRSSTGEIALQRRITPPVQPWAIAKPIQAWADRELLDQLLADLAALRVESVEAGEASAEIPSPLPENAALLQAQVFGIPTPLTIYLRQVEAPPVEGAPALVEVRVSDRPAVFRLQSRILEEIPRTADVLRDRTLARIPMSYLSSMTIQSRIDPDVFLKSVRVDEGMAWDVKVNNRLLPANLNLVTGLVTGVNEAAILDFVSEDENDLAEYGLMPPARRIAFELVYPGAVGEDGTVGPAQTVIRILNLGWREGEEQRLFANFEGESQIFELDPTFLGLFPTHPIKWRSLNVLTFNPFHLESITREQLGGEILKLDYDYRRDGWDAFRSGVDVSQSLDRAAAGRLRDRLGSLTATGWYLSLAQAYESLQEPTVRFEILTNELDPAVGEARPMTREIKLAPAPTDGFYFGQVEGSPDVFYLDHGTYRDLIRPVTTSRLSNPN